MSTSTSVYTNMLFCYCLQLLIQVSFATLWTAACQPPLSIGFPRQEYWSRLPFSTPGDLPDPGIKPASPASLLYCRQSVYLWATRNTTDIYTYVCIIIDYAKAFDCVDNNKLWKILREMGIPDHLTCLLRNLYAGQEAPVRTRHGAMNWFQIGTESVKVVYCHPAYLTYMQSTLCEMPSWMKHKLQSRFPGEISVTSDMQITTL